MKKMILAVMLLGCLLALCACGAVQNTPQPTPSAPPAPSASSSLPGSDLSAAPAPEVEQESAPVYDEEKFNAALGFKDKDVSALYEAIGEPADSSYAPSCLGPGEDGELYYDGFTVATYREGESEIIREVYVNAG